MMPVGDFYIVDVNFAVCFSGMWVELATQKSEFVAESHKGCMDLLAVAAYEFLAFNAYVARVAIHVKVAPFT